jgi:hypothetical protein
MRIGRGIDGVDAERRRGRVDDASAAALTPSIGAIYASIAQPICSTADGERGRQGAARAHRRTDNQAAWISDDRDGTYGANARGRMPFR